MKNLSRNFEERIMRCQILLYRQKRKFERKYTTSFYALIMRFSFPAFLAFSFRRGDGAAQSTMMRISLPAPPQD